MLAIFRRNLVLNSLLLLVYTFLLRIDSLLGPGLNQPLFGESFLSTFISSSSFSPLTQSIIMVFLVYFCALLINLLVIKNKITKEITMIPGLVFILFTSLLPDNTGLNNALIANIFILGSLLHLYSTYSNKPALHHIFLAGFYAGIAGILYFPLTYLIGILYIGFLIIRSFVFKEKIQLFLGWLIAFLLCMVAQYWQFDQNFLIPYYFNINSTIHISFLFTSITNYVIIGLLGFLTFVLLIKRSSFLSKKTTSVQKKIGILYWLYFYACLVFFIIANLNTDHLFVIALPASILFSIILITMKNKLIAEVIHLLLVLFVFVIKFNLITF